MIEKLAEEYKKRFDVVLKPTATNLRSYIINILEGIERVDSVSVRGKSPERFAGKALKSDEFGNLKYSDPINQIQDQIGARITVFYLSDIEIIKKIIADYFTAIEQQDKKPERNEEFGYFGEHFVLRLPDDVIPSGMEHEAPQFFELQVKTLFQHAWSECHHDIGYKAPRELTAHERRQMAFSAAQSWGADQIFKELANNLVPLPNNDI